MSNIFKATKENIQKAAEIIKSGGVIATPTDTIYGLSADVYNINAIERVFAIKGRNFKNPLISHIHNLEMLPSLAQTDEQIMTLAKKFWPGSLTMVLNRIEEKKEFDLICAGRRTISVRIPNHNVALELLRQTKRPLISTSANLSEHPFPKTAEEVYAQLSESVDMILDDGPSPIGLESTILDMTQTPPKILRQGAISEEELKSIL